jgi:MurNAc alpha-1-phosphate uridylyltransferase
MQDGQVSGEYYAGQWMDIGSPQRLSELDLKLRA